MTENQDTFTDLAFAITADTGTLGYQAALLIRSIRQQYENPDIFTFVPAVSYPKLTDDIRDVFEQYTTVIVDEIPLPEYPPTALQKAFVEAADRSNSTYTAAIDSDALLFSKLQRPPTAAIDADLFVKPVDFAERYWGSSHSKEDWRRAYSYFDVPLPDMPSDLYGDVDSSQLTAPYYQAAVVITSDNDLPARWLEMTCKSATAEIYQIEEDWFHDQITLSVLSQNYTTEQLSYKQNYPLYAAVTCPNSVQLVHYQNGAQLYRHKSNRNICQFSQYDEFSKVIKNPTVSDYYILFQNNAARFVPYPHNRKINYPIKLARNVCDILT